MPYEEFFSNTPRVDITFPEETIVHALLAEQHLGSAHDSNELSEPEKILYAIVKAVKDKYPQFAEFQEGCYDSDLILGAFYININIFHDEEGPYMTMNISLNDGFFEGVSW